MSGVGAPPCRPRILPRLPLVSPSDSGVAARRPWLKSAHMYVTCNFRHRLPAVYERIFAWQFGQQP
eukprot:943530-Alexandrium_andersonii.AAC.1